MRRILHQNLEETFSAWGESQHAIRRSATQIVLKKEDSEGWRCRKLGRLAGKKKLKVEVSGRVANDGRLIIMSE